MTKPTKPMPCLYCGGPTLALYCSDACKKEALREHHRVQDAIIDWNLEADLERAAEECFSQEP